MKKSRAAFQLFTVANIIFAFVIGLLYLKVSPPTSFLQAVFYGFSLFAYLALAFGFLHLALSFFSTKIKIYMQPLVFTLFLLILTIDTQIYQYFRFHINPLVWNVLSTEGGWDTLGITNYEVSIYVAAAFALLVGQYFVLRRLLQLKIRKLSLNFCLSLSLVLTLGSSLVYAYGDLYDIPAITRVHQVIPLYQPLTIKRTYAKWFGRLPSPDINIKISEGSLNYPLKKIEAENPPKKYNFIFLVVDCFRLQSFNEEVTPYLWDFSKNSQTFLNHYSGGNGTRNGVFSLLYGIHSSYWDHFLRENQSPIFLDRIQELNYKTAIITSTVQSFPEFERTAFVNMQESISDDYKGSAHEKDKAVLNDIRDFIKNNKDEPFFVYSLLDSAHSTYSFPSSHVKFHPIVTIESYTKLTDEEKRLHVKNRYHNSLNYIDQLLNDFLEDLKTLDVLDDTIVIITGDHGDEFMEFGHIGHSNAFTPQQTMSPLLLYHPEKKGKTYNHITSHLDVIPTLAPYLGIQNPTEDYAHGKNLFSPSEYRDILTCSWDNCALVDDEGYMIFGTKSYNSQKIEFRDLTYKIIPKTSGFSPKRATRTTSLLKEMSEFLK